MAPCPPASCPHTLFHGASQFSIQRWSLPPPCSLAGPVLAVANRMDRSGVGLRACAAHSDLVSDGGWLGVRTVGSPSARVWQAHGKPGWKPGRSQGQRVT